MAARKLIIQIPCFNEADHLAATLQDLPRTVPGIDTVEILVIDDGSSDATADVARRCGADYILRFSNNRGLARAFRAGLDAALKLGADIIVNTDGDNQYSAEDLPRLVQPILEGKAEIVIGDREPATLEQFSRGKRLLQYYGSWVVRTLSGTDVPDATSGFRALSREAALRLNVISDFTYTLETVIQAGKKRLPITHTPVHVNPMRRTSKLFHSVWQYMKRSTATIVRIYALYEPLKVFSYLGGSLILLGMIPALRFVYYYFQGAGSGHIQSLLLTVLLIIIGFQTILIGLVADLIAANRSLIEDVLFRIRCLELGEKQSGVEDVRQSERHRPRAQGGHL